MMEEGENIEIVCIESEERSRKKHKKKKTHSKYEFKDSDRRKTKSYENEETVSRKKYKKKRSHSKYEYEGKDRRKKRRYETVESDNEKEDNSCDIIELYSHVIKTEIKKEKKRKSKSSFEEDHKNIKKQKKKHRRKEEIIVDDDSDIELTSKSKKFSKSKYEKRVTNIEIEKKCREKTFKVEKKYYSHLSDYSSSIPTGKYDTKDSNKKAYFEKYVDENRRQGSKTDKMKGERKSSKYENEKGRSKRKKSCQGNNNNDSYHKYPSEKNCNTENKLTLGSLSEIDDLPDLNKIRYNGKERMGNSKKIFHENSEQNRFTAKEHLRHHESKAGSSSTLSKNIETLSKNIKILRRTTDKEKYSATKDSFESHLTSSIENEIAQELEVAKEIRTSQKHQEDHFTHRRTDHSIKQVESNIGKVINEPQESNHNDLHASLTKSILNQISKMAKDSQKHKNHLRKISKLSQNSYMIASSSTIAIFPTTVDNCVGNENILKNSNPIDSSFKQLQYKNLVTSPQEKNILPSTENYPDMLHKAENPNKDRAVQLSEYNFDNGSENTSHHNKSIKVLKQKNNYKLFDNIENKNKQKKEKENLTGDKINSFRQNGIKVSEHFLNDSNESQLASHERSQMNNENMRGNTNKQQQNINVVDNRNRYQEGTDVSPSICQKSIKKENKNYNNQNCDSDNSMVIENDSNHLINESSATQNCGKLFTISNVQGNITINDENVSDDLNPTSDMCIWPQNEMNPKKSRLNIKEEGNHILKDSSIKLEEIVAMNEIHSEVYDQVDSKAFVRSIISNEYLEHFGTESKVILHKTLREDGLFSDNLDTAVVCDENNQEVLAQAEENVLTILPKKEIKNELDISLSKYNENHKSTKIMDNDILNNKNTTKNNLDQNQPSSSQHEFNVESIKNIDENVINTNIEINCLDLQHIVPEANTVHSEISSSESPMFQIESVWSMTTASQDNANHYPIPEDLAEEIEVIEIGRVKVTKTSACSFRIKKENQVERNYYVAHREIEQCPMCQRKLNNDQFKFNPMTMILTMVCFCTLTIYQLLNPEKDKSLRVR